MERRRPARLVAPIPLGPRPNDQGAQRAERFVGAGGPVEPIALTGRAGELLRVLADAVGVAILRVVIPLRVHVGQTRLDRVQLVPADAPREDLLASLLRIESPALPVFHERDRERPVVVANLEHRGVTARDELVRSVVRAQELLSALLVGHRIAGRNERAALTAEDPQQRLGVARAQGRDEGLRRLLG